MPTTVPGAMDSLTKAGDRGRFLYCMLSDPKQPDNLLILQSWHIDLAGSSQYFYVSRGVKVSRHFSNMP